MGSLITTSTFSCNIQQFRTRIQRLDNSWGPRSWTSSEGVRLVLGEYPYVKWVYESIQDGDHVPMGMLKWDNELERPEDYVLEKQRPSTRASWIVLRWSSSSMRPSYHNLNGFYVAGIEAYEEANNRVRVDFIDGFSPEDPKKECLQIGQAFKEFACMLLQEINFEVDSMGSDGFVGTTIETERGVIDKVKLKNIIREKFNLDELHDLCFNIGLDKEYSEEASLPGLTNWMINMVSANGKILTLVNYIISMKPDLNFADFTLTDREG